MYSATTPQMLVKWALNVVAILIFATTAELASLSSQEQFLSLVSHALANPRLSSSLPLVHTLVLKAFQRRSESCVSFFEYICQKYKSPKRPKSKAENSSFWSNLIESHFRGFALASQAQAQAVVTYTIIAAHPLSRELEGSFQIVAFISEASQKLESFFRRASYDFFNERWAKMFSITDEPNALYEFHHLINKFKTTFEHQRNSESIYACAFLMNLGFERVRFLAFKDGPLSFPEDPVDFSAQLYK